MLSESELEGYIQTVAFDISEIYYNSEKIRMNNEKLEVLKKKLKKIILGVAIIKRIWYDSYRRW